MEEELVKALLGVVERNTGALERIAEVVETQKKATDENAKMYRELAQNMKHLTGAIKGAQRKIGEEVGGIIDRSKETITTMNKEIEHARVVGDLDRVGRLSRIRAAAEANEPPAPPSRKKVAP